MTFSFLRVLLTLAMWVLIIAALLLAAGSLGSLISGEPLQTSLAVVTDRPVERPVTVASSSNSGVLALSHGAITLRPDGLVFALQLLHVTVILAASLAILWLLRKAILSVAAGNPFDAGSIRRVRNLGLIQIGTFLWINIHQVVLQTTILPRLSMADGAAILSSIAWRKAGVENIQIDISLGFAWLIGGLIALAAAEALRIGTEYRRDSEAIV